MKHHSVSLLSFLLACLFLMAGCSGPVYSLEVDGDMVGEFTFADVEAALRAMDNSYESYVLLAPEQAIENSIYLQAYLPTEGYDDGLGYYVEICMENPFIDYRYYQARTTDLNDVIRCFSRYYKGQQIPNIAAWEDVTWDDYDYGDDYDYYDDYGYGGYREPDNI